MNHEIEHISFSQISQWMGCQKQYWLQRIEEAEPVDVGASLVIGTAYHAALEVFYKARMKGDVPVGLNELVAIFEQVILEEEAGSVVNWGRTNRDTEVTKATGVFKVFLENVQDLEVVGVEKMFRLDVDDLPPILGRVDLIERDKQGALVIVDFKSASARPSTSTDIYVPGDVDASHQMTLYQLWAKQAYPNTPIKLRMDYFIKSAKNPLCLRMESTRSSEDEHRLVQLMISAWGQIQMAKAGVIEPLPIRSFRCGGCGYRARCASLGCAEVA